MGQKMHPSGVRLGYSQEWGNVWYTLKKKESSVLLFQTFVLKSLLSYYLYKRNLFLHSFSINYINNSLYLFVNIVPKFTNIFNHFKFLTSKNLKNRLKRVRLRFLRTNRLSFSKISSSTGRRNLTNKISSATRRSTLRSNLNNLSRFFVRKKVSSKKFLKIEVPFMNFNLLLKAICKFTNFGSVVLKFVNLSKSCYITRSIFFDLKINQVYQSWYYYFLMMRKFGISSSLLCYCIKNLIETRSLRKKQLFFLRNLKAFLRSFCGSNLFSLIKGIKILVTGRLNGRSRASFYKIQLGSLPLSTFSEKISYTFVPAFNVYGSYGIKVWISYV